ncbi:MAG: hypothetical protein JXR22_12190 [Prolixibacteraceae bacterium]|nr:hypothetical protein [Prolixibacteraceae bacterium]
MKLIGLSILGLMILFLTTCDQKETFDPRYPTTIEELTNSELDQLLNLLNKTPLAKYTSIDYFGFASFRDGTDDSIKAMTTGIDVSEETLTEMTRQALLDYGTFLNASDPSKLQIRTISTITNLQYEQFTSQYPDSLPAAWRITTFQQYYEGYEVRGSSLNFIFSSEGLIALSGHWYHDIYLPDSLVYSEEAAKQSMIGKTLTYQNKTFIPKEDTYWHNSKLVILPLRLNKLVKRHLTDTIELRFCWALYPEGWEILVDTQTGEKLSESIIGQN